ncbi:MAG: hypothetical protein VX388_07870, partial [Pseudomonadota bacterium]|nr:hypothetical protein [Pseudomonadota bacterium]
MIHQLHARQKRGAGNALGIQSLEYFTAPPIFDLICGDFFALVDINKSVARGYETGVLKEVFA